MSEDKRFTFLFDMWGVVVGLFEEIHNLHNFNYSMLKLESNNTGVLISMREAIENTRQALVYVTKEIAYLKQFLNISSLATQIKEQELFDECEKIFAANKDEWEAILKHHKKNKVLLQEQSKLLDKANAQYQNFRNRYEEYKKERDSVPVKIEPIEQGVV